MSAYFRKSIKIAPGVHINLSKRGTGVSFGARGAHVSFSPTGRVTKTVSIPGTGIYYRDVSSVHQKAKSASKEVPTEYPEVPTSNNYEQPVPAAHHVEAVDRHGFYISHGAAAFLAIIAAAVVQGKYKQTGVSLWGAVFIGIAFIAFVLWVRDLVVTAKEGRAANE